MRRTAGPERELDVKLEDSGEGINVNKDIEGKVSFRKLQEVALQLALKLGF